MFNRGLYINCIVLAVDLVLGSWAWDGLDSAKDDSMPPLDFVGAAPKASS